ncbi:LuxR C-terminal-related transcriptional regulator [Pseudescherichia vulneris]
MLTTLSCEHAKTANSPTEGTMLPPQTLHFFTRSAEPWAITDTAFCFLYANQAYFDLLKIPEDIAQNITGSGYGNVPVLAPLEDGLITHDKRVIQTGQRIEAIGTVLVDSDFHSFIFEKFPFFSAEGQIAGTISHLKTFKRLSMHYFLEMPFCGKATFTPPTTILSKREWEVLFLLYRGLQRAQIAQRLGISEYSARNVVSRLFLKTAVNSKEQLLNLGLKQGWHLYVPPAFVSPGYDLIFEDDL